MANNKKDRIMDLMRRGIISEDEALELLEKANLTGEDNQGDTADDASDGSSKFSYTDKEGYVNHNVDFADSMKNTFENLFEKSKEVFKGVAKSVDDNIDFGNGFPKVKSVSTEIEKDIDGEFSAVNLDVKNGKIAVKPGENAHVKVQYKVYGAVENGDVDAYVAEKTTLEVIDNILEITTSGRISAEVELYLPEKSYDKVALNVLHGEIEVEKLVADVIEVSQVNGDVELKETTSKSLTVTTKNGEIKAIDGRSTEMNLNSINGNFRVTNDFETADLSLVNGNILVTESSVGARKLNVKNVNGDIKVSVPEALGLVGHVRTIFGSYKTRLNLDNPFEAGRNGAAVVRSGENTLTFELETKSGTIWLKDID
ncbi:DUF4097 family beta strand repeat-containing protein [Lactococcus nasutitermitis]|uniref:DUF4097 family beta strand repeat-containing protein n=1 Tax=Lactococcus nasutitermitis TaxID=1652957 RepID=A0ABV9JB31_9LACT|nr:DUF4097 domain-containing protein [Lactococcus nasutitermitis]